jgi:hypothetical protein
LSPALFSTGRFISGNGLVSYYINLVLDGVGITDTRRKAEINGGLQVPVPFNESRAIFSNFCVPSQAWNLACAMTGALLVDRLGRRTLFIISNAGMAVVFAMWTLTTALFRTTGNTAAAKGGRTVLARSYKPPTDRRRQRPCRSSSCSI